MDEPGQPVSRNQSFHHFRYIIIILGGLTMGSMFQMRLTITVAMISMVNHTALYIREHPNSSETDWRENFSGSYIETGDFEWTNEIQQAIISGYMVAYAIPQFFTTRLAMRQGLRLGIPISLSLCSLSNILTPMLSYWGWQFALALRLLNGLGASAIIPCMMNVIENWVPSCDSAKGVVLLQFVATLLYAMAPLISGLLASIHWVWAFYVPAIIGLFFAFIWWVFASDSPESSKYLSQKELELIIKGTKGTSDSIKTDKGYNGRKVKQELPWYMIYRIKVFYVLVTIWSLYCASLHGFLFLMPMYINRVLRVPVSEIGALNFYVQVGSMFCMLWPNPAISALQRVLNVSLSTARSIVVFICTAAVCGTFSYIAFYHDNLVIMICVNRFFHLTNDTVVMATVMSQFSHAGVSGLIYSMMNSIGNLMPLIFCWAVGKFLDYTGETLECWSWVLGVMAMMNVLYFIIYSTCCPSERIEIANLLKEVGKTGERQCYAENETTQASKCDRASS